MVRLFADDIRYWMPIRYNLFERPEDIRDELSKPGEGFYFDDDRRASRSELSAPTPKTPGRRCRRRARAI